MDLRAVICESGEKLGYKSLKDKQVEAVCSFTEGNDVFVSLPTGYGKSTIYAILPFVFDKIRGMVTNNIVRDVVILGTSGSIVLCISPLTAIMMDQVSKYNSRGLETEFIGAAQTSVEKRDRVMRGEIQLVFVTPETIIGNARFRNMLLSPTYREKLICVAVDEAHCVKLWGGVFRPQFAEIGVLRSIIPSAVHILALTATATKETFYVISNQLSMVKPVLVGLPPNRENIMFEVHHKIDIDSFATNLSDELKEKQMSFPKTIIYVRSHMDAIKIYSFLKKSLGKFYTFPPDYPNHQDYRLIDMFISAFTDHRKEEVLSLFTRPKRILRLIIATTAFGLGVDCPNIRRIIHWGFPSTLEEYVQETGRSGRDGEAAKVIVYRGVGARHATAKVKEYVANSTKCRRQLLFHEFLLYSESSMNIGNCKCCDVCMLICKCSLCS